MQKTENKLKNIYRVTSLNSIHQKKKNKCINQQPVDSARADRTVLNIRVCLQVFTRNSQDLITSRMTAGWACV